MPCPRTLAAGLRRSTLKNVSIQRSPDDLLCSRCLPNAGAVPPRQIGVNSFNVRAADEFERRIGEADVVVVSGLWRNELLEKAHRLRFIQSIGAGTDQFDREKLKRRGIRLASAQGVNVRAVAEHAMALILAITRRLPEARDDHGEHAWCGMISDLTQREDELGGKTLLIIGLGGIGSRLAQLAKAFGMRVIGIK